MFRKLFYLVLVVAAGLAIWVGFALWTGIYSVYSIPPGPKYPDGSTLLVSREPGEPLFNSPAYVPPPPPPRKKGGLGFGPITRPRRPIAERTIVTLPYIEWAYKQSIEPPAPGKSNPE